MNLAQRTLAQAFDKNAKATCGSGSNGCTPAVAKATCGSNGPPSLTKAMCDFMSPPPSEPYPQEPPNCMTGPMVARMVSNELPTFDLTDIRARVAKDNPTLSAEVLVSGETQYREFLRNAKVNPAAKNQPSLLVDEFWHAHILYTQQYMENCRTYFGYYLHHNPLG